ncbi:MAG: homoaconitate hydratase family protein [Chloroflexi bacterium]|nr:homoaconitate hydratase family protein [Chloroflexota bacterium]
MPATFVEKVLARTSGQRAVVVGQIVDASPDVILSHDNTAAISKIFRALGQARVRYPDRHAITLDHAVPAPNTQHATNHADVRKFVAEQGITNFFEAGRGICHQVLSEEGIALPGSLVIGSDSHTPHFGWLGACGVGVGRSEMAAIWATGELWLRVPESVRIIVDGRLPFGVTAKDLALHIIGRFGADGGIYQSIEFSGSGVMSLTLDSRGVIPNMMAEFGAKNAYIPPDDILLDWLAPRYARRLALRHGSTPWRAERPATGGRGAARDGRGTPDAAEVASRRAEIAARCVLPDAEASYVATHHMDANVIEPLVACPHTVDNVKPLSQVRGTRVQQAFLGTCTNGRVEDLAAAAEVVKGKHVAPGTRLVVIPASSEIMVEALRLGYVQTLVEAGAMIGTPGCGPCMGNHFGVPAPNEVTISSANRNFRGRMGTRDSEIYLASPAVVAASAIAGCIADPREVRSNDRVRG